MDRILYAVLTVLHPVFSLMSHLPQFGFVFFFLGAWEAVRVKFRGMLLYVLLCCLCFFSPNIAVLIEKKLHSPELQRAHPRGETVLFYGGAGGARGAGR